MNKTNDWVVVLLFALIIFMAILTGFFPKVTINYKQGVKDTYKEAFANGLMIKEIDKDDNVIYRWIELHKLQNEDN